MNKLNSNKAHGDDMISICMLKLCNKSICKPLIIIFKSCLTEGIFPSQWKKASIVPIHQKNDKDCVKNYRSASLLPICSKVLERIIYNTMLTYFKVILVLINYQPLLMKYFQALMIITKLEQCSLIFQKFLINCGSILESVKSFINLNATGSQEIY